MRAEQQKKAGENNSGLFYNLKLTPVLLQQSLYQLFQLRLIPGVASLRIRI